MKKAIETLEKLTFNKFIIIKKDFKIAWSMVRNMSKANLPLISYFGNLIIIIKLC